MKLRIYWFPQVPCKPFYFPVNTLEEAIAVNNALASYDMFLYNNNHRGDYANAGGLEVWDESFGGEWVDWYSEEEESFDEYIRRIETEKEENEEANG